MMSLKFFYSIQILAVLLGLSTYSNAQIVSSGKDWGGLTQYSKVGAIQDSIFVFFSSSASPKRGDLKAKFSDGSKSSYTWYKYNDAIINPANRFVIIAGATDSIQTDLERGGYRVSVKRVSDNTIQVYTCWVMIDEIVIDSLNINHNGCDYLEIKTITIPIAATNVASSSFFLYWDISKTNHPVINSISTKYFKEITWTPSNSQITIPSGATLTLVIEDTAPLYDSKYNIRIVNYFGRVLASETAEMLTAKAAKADFKIFVDKDDTWEDGGTEPSGEAPLKLKLESYSINADSIYWRVINDVNLFKKGADSIVWRDSSLFSATINSEPTPEKMVPGKYPVKHIAQNTISGCIDTMTIFVTVDSSAIKPDAIPNVFTPNGDGENDYFKFKEPETNISSIKFFHIYIISRGGQLVYEYSGDPKTWEGWNGEKDGKKGNVPEGVYYYIIEAVGWDNRLFKRGKYKGFLHLFRGK